MIPTIITGSNSNHLLSLKQLLYSIFDIYKQGEVRVVVWDLGFTDTERQYIENLFELKMKRFNYSQYPSFFNITISAGEYAWKPSLIKETVDEFGSGIYLWLDAGDKISGNLTALFRYIGGTGLYSDKTSGNISNLTHPGVYSKIDSRFREYAGKSMRNGANIGFDYSKPWVRELIDSWATWALDKEIIAPEGSSKTNHRQDQSLFSLLYWDYANKIGFDTTTIYRHLIKIHQDVE